MRLSIQYNTIQYNTIHSLDEPLLFYSFLLQFYTFHPTTSLFCFSSSLSFLFLFCLYLLSSLTFSLSYMCLFLTLSVECIFRQFSRRCTCFNSHANVSAKHGTSSLVWSYVLIFCCTYNRSEGMSGHAR